MRKLSMSHKVLKIPFDAFANSRVEVLRVERALGFCFLLFFCYQFKL